MNAKDCSKMKEKELKETSCALVSERVPVTSTSAVPGEDPERSQRVNS